MIQWLIDNKEWVFSGIGVALLAGFFTFSRGLMNKRTALIPAAPEPISVVNQNIVTVGSAVGMAPNSKTITPSSPKATTHILVIDDDQKFKVVNILKQSGWIYTKRTSDIGSLDDAVVQQADILFVDIQGVGRRLKFKDEGLGLALAIKDKYPHKKVVIYSAQTQGERFHDALRKADDFLPKNADPYEFQQLTERLASEIQRGA